MIAGAIMFLVFLPNLLWNIQHHCCREKNTLPTVVNGIEILLFCRWELGLLVVG
jgi:hypothetical protein